MKKVAAAVALGVAVMLSAPAAPAQAARVVPMTNCSFC